MSWQVEFHPTFLEEFGELSESVQDELAAMVELLKVAGPQLKRPRADTLKNSAHANMKELRFDADDGVWRLASGICLRSRPEGDSARGWRQIRRFRTEILQATYPSC